MKLIIYILKNKLKCEKFEENSDQLPWRQYRGVPGAQSKFFAS